MGLSAHVSADELASLSHRFEAMGPLFEDMTLLSH